MTTAPQLTDQQLADKARELDEECCLIISGKQQNWLWELLYDDEGEAKPPQLSPNARAFLQHVCSGRYSDGVTQ
jgi:hypothetical protein